MRKWRMSGVWLAGLWLFLSVFSFGETVNCIVAVVNNQILTLADLQLVEAFALYDMEEGEYRYPALLERMIDQKVVTDLAREKVAVEKDQVKEELQSLLDRIGFEEAQKKFDGFGVAAGDLMSYLEEKILYQKIIDLRFSQSVSVSLQEIEAYYKDTYLPDQKKAGLEPRPMMELLNEIESEIKKEKIKVQVEAWIKNLRRQAEIEVKWDCLKRTGQKEN
ncbi:MAG: hypothetical protein WCC06_06635 [Candidatus Aminicenantales bacterium]